jgi:hypothetical protein
MVQRTSGINASVAWHVASISFNPQTRNSYFHTRYIKLDQLIVLIIGLAASPFKVVLDKAYRLHEVK